MRAGGARLRGRDDRRHEARDRRLAPVDDRPVQQRQPQHTRERRRGEQRRLAVELRAAVHVQRIRRGVFAVRRGPAVEHVVGRDAERPCAVARGERADARRRVDVDRTRGGRVVLAYVRTTLGRADDHGGRPPRIEQPFERGLVQNVETGGVFRRQRDPPGAGGICVPDGRDQRQRRFARQRGGNRTAEQAGRADEKDGRLRHGSQR
jgi:hypothetical protein